MTLGFTADPFNVQWGRLGHQKLTRIRKRALSSVANEVSAAFRHRAPLAGLSGLSGFIGGFVSLLQRPAACFADAVGPRLRAFPRSARSGFDRSFVSRAAI